MQHFLNLNIFISIYLSLAFFVVSIYCYNKKPLSATARFFYSFLNFVFLISYLFYGIVYWFIGKNFNEAVLYHIRIGIAGVNLKEYWQLILTPIILTILFVIWCVFVFLWNTKTKKNNKFYFYYLSIVFLIFAILLNPIIIGFYQTYYGYKAKKSSANFYDFYKKPNLTETAPKKNLVYIYAEGFERTYFNENIFPGLVTDLKEIELKSTSFTNINELAGANCTIGGIVSSQCGIPLFTPYGKENSTHGFEDYLSSIMCLSDLLNDENYYLSYFGGASLKFAGKGNFLNTHNFDEINGKENLISKLNDSSYQSFWGLHDDSLTAIAYESFLELSNSENNFAMFLLTLDTHHPDGYQSKTCENMIYQDGKNKMLNAIKCSDYVISNFVNKISSSKYASDTIIAISSDHLAHRNAASKLLNKGERKNLFMIINPEKPEKNIINKNGSTLDIFPTLLPSMGYEAQMGLGRNLKDAHSTSEEIKTIQQNIPFWKDDVVKLWNFPQIQKKIKIDKNNNILKIDERIFNLPALIKINSDLQTTLFLGINSSEEINNIKDNEAFVFIERASNVGVGNYYLIIGQGDKIIKRQKVNENIEFTKADLKNIFNF